MTLSKWTNEKANGAYVYDVIAANIGSRELKYVRFWDADGNRKWAVFTFNLPSHNHSHIAKYRFSIRNEQYKNVGVNTFLAREKFSSGCRTRLKKARA